MIRDMITEIYKKYMVQGESWEHSKEIHEKFTNSCFCVNVICPFINISSTAFLYYALTLYPHTMFVHVWFGLFMANYMNRVLMGILQNDTGTRFYLVKVPAITTNMVTIVGAVTGAIWLSLLWDVMFHDIYPIESKLLVSAILMLFTYSTLSFYSLTPTWCFGFAIVTYVPICIVLLFYGILGIATSMIIAGYVTLLLTLTYRSYKLHFETAYLQYQLQNSNTQLVEEVRLRKIAEAEVRKLAETDKLTGVTNRLSLDDKMEKAFRLADKSKKFVGVVFIDLDKFKPVNDTYGHDVGDQLLCAVTNRMKECIRPIDEIFRIGGDEFVILFTNLENEETLNKLCKKIIETCNKPYIIEGHTLPSSVSMGVSLYKGTGENPEEFLQSADKAMYESKKGGGDSFTLHCVS